MRPLPLLRLCGRRSQFSRRSPEQFSTVVSFPGSSRVQGELVMRNVSEYKLRAEECRRLATHMKDPEQKKQLEEMAQAWELLARARIKHLQEDGTSRHK